MITLFCLLTAQLVCVRYVWFFVITENIVNNDRSQLGC